MGGVCRVGGWSRKVSQGMEQTKKDFGGHGEEGRNTQRESDRWFREGHTQHRPGSAAGFKILLGDEKGDGVTGGQAVKSHTIHLSPTASGRQTLVCY